MRFVSDPALKIQGVQKFSFDIYVYDALRVNFGHKPGSNSGFRTYELSRASYQTSLPDLGFFPLTENIIFWQDSHGDREITDGKPSPELQPQLPFAFFLRVTL